MLKKNNGPIIQVDRLIFDTRTQTRKTSTVPDSSHSSAILSFSSKLSNNNKEDISKVSHVSFPLNKIKIIRLTFDDLNREKLFFKTNEQKINSIYQQSSSILQEKAKTMTSPVYESTDEKRYSIHVDQNKTTLYDN
ncbi:unnamed protein product [Rotaria socialis]|uniref:Uncharacterized protein n=1 Tax=Rotaria socialis TaxID=392032 RepID=A0A818WTE8_9BILA|nr:unnamed protein product [Rotaria socialis]CAF4311728.1 unnamed protein product [Rotaria socialis]